MAWCTGDPVRAVRGAGLERQWVSWSSSRSQGRWSARCWRPALQELCAAVRKGAPHHLGFLSALLTDYLGLGIDAAAFFRKDAAQSLPALR